MAHAVHVHPRSAAYTVVLVQSAVATQRERGIRVVSEEKLIIPKSHAQSWVCHKNK